MGPGTAEDQLREASIHNDLPNLVHLIQQGANPCHTDEDGMTALHYAAWGGNLDSVAFLAMHSIGHVQHGVKGYSCINMRSTCGYTALHISVQSGMQCTKELCKILLWNGADATIKDEIGKSVLDLAQTIGVNDDVMSILHMKTKDMTIESDPICMDIIGRIQSLTCDKERNQLGRKEEVLEQFAREKRGSNERSKQYIISLQQTLTKAKIKEKRMREIIFHSSNDEGRGIFQP